MFVLVRSEKLSLNLAIRANFLQWTRSDADAKKVHCRSFLYCNVYLLYNRSMKDEEFQKLVDDAISGIPKEFLEKLENVAIVIEDWPSDDQIKGAGLKGNDLLFGLYQGIPQTGRGRYGIGGSLPDKITIFKIPHLLISRDYLVLKRKVEETVIHEIAHHFGMGEDDITKPKK